MADLAEDEELKMWLAVRADLDMPRGKLATQAGHGYANCLLRALAAEPDMVDRYQRSAMAKITVQVPSEAALRRVEAEAESAGIANALVVDAGRTIFAGPTATVCAFGPALRSALPPFLRRLRLLDSP